MATRSAIAQKQEAQAQAISGRLQSLEEKIDHLIALMSTKVDVEDIKKGFELGASRATNKATGKG